MHKSRAKSSLNRIGFGLLFLLIKKSNRDTIGIFDIKVTLHTWRIFLLNISDS